MRYYHNSGTALDTCCQKYGAPWTGHLVLYRQESPRSTLAPRIPQSGVRNMSRTVRCVCHGQTSKSVPCGDLSHAARHAIKSNLVSWTAQICVPGYASVTSATGIPPSMTFRTMGRSAMSTMRVGSPCMSRRRFRARSHLWWAGSEGMA